MSVINFTTALVREDHISGAAVRTHEKNVRGLRCVITRTPFVTMHHCHGGSMKDFGWHVGIAQKQNPFLQIPLMDEYHTGGCGIDSGYGVRSWEKDFGTQVEHLQWVNDQLPYDIFVLAERWEQENRANTETGRSPTKR